MHNPSQVGAVGLGVMGDGPSPILSSGTVQPVCQLPELVMEIEAGRDRLTREAAPGGMPRERGCYNYNGRKCSNYSTRDDAIRGTTSRG